MFFTLTSPHFTPHFMKAIARKAKQVGRGWFTRKAGKSSFVQSWEGTAVNEQ